MWPDRAAQSAGAGPHLSRGPSPALTGYGRRLTLVGTPAVPTVTDAVVEAMADDFERRFRTHSVDVFNPAGLWRVWANIGLGARAEDHAAGR